MTAVFPPTQLIHANPLPPPACLPPSRYAGFTAGTGRANASHMITSWKFFEVGGQREDKGGDDFFGLGRLADNLFGRSE